MALSMLATIGRDVQAMLHEQVTSRELLRAFVWRDLLVRYRQAVLGFAWAVLSPLLNVMVFSVIFTRVVPLRTDVPYPVFAFAGLWPWALFSSALRAATVSLSANTTLVTKVHFAREVLPFAAVAVAFVDFLVAGVLMVGLMAWYDIPLGLHVLLLAAIVAVQLAFTGGLALLFSMANLYWRDTRHFTEVLLGVWMFATSVVYPLEGVEGWLGQLLALNPMTPVIDAYRAVLLEGRLPAAGPMAYAASVAVIVLFVGWITFHRNELHFAERA